MHASQGGQGQRSDAVVDVLERKGQLHDVALQPHGTESVGSLP